MPYVRLIEMWIRRREDDSLQRKIAIVGDVLVADQSFGTEKWYEDNADTPRPPNFPVGICQYSATGSGIYSRGFAEMLIPLNTEIEAMLQSVVKSIKEYDEFGIILFPSTLGVTKRDFKISSKPKIGTYEPDPAVPQARPFQMRPVNAGTLPQSVLSLMLSLADRQSSQSPILRGDAPGRVDSNSALTTLFQASNIPLAGPARSLATAYRKVYSALMYEAKRRWGSTDKLRMTTIDDSVAGLVLDPKTLSVKADSSGVPWPHEVEIGVKSTEAEDKAQKQQLAMQLSESKKKMWIFNYKTELGLPDLEPRIKESVRKAMLINVLLYGDGETPGDPKMDEDADDLEVLLVIVEDFMARIEFSLSENKVKEAFKHYQNELKSRIGGQVPEQAPDFLQAAIQAQQVVAQQQQAAAQGGPV